MKRIWIISAAALSLTARADDWPRWMGPRRERLWQTTVPTTGSARKGRDGTAFLVKRGDRFFLFNEQGDLILAKLSPPGYEELGRFHVLEPTNTTFGRAMVWSHPAFAQKCLFARNDKELVCVDLAAPGS